MIEAPIQPPALERPGALRVVSSLVAVGASTIVALGFSAHLFVAGAFGGAQAVMLLAAVPPVLAALVGRAVMKHLAPLGGLSGSAGPLVAIAAFAACFFSSVRPPEPLDSPILVVGATGLLAAAIAALALSRWYLLAVVLVVVGIAVAAWAMTTSRQNAVAEAQAAGLTRPYTIDAPPGMVVVDVMIGADSAAISYSGPGESPVSVHSFAPGHAESTVTATATECRTDASGSDEGDGARCLVPGLPAGQVVVVGADAPWTEAEVARLAESATPASNRSFYRWVRDLDGTGVVRNP